MIANLPFADSFESYDNSHAAEAWYAFTGPTVMQGVAARAGSGYLSCNGSAGATARFSAQSAYVLGHALWFVTGSTASGGNILSFASTGVAEFALGFAAGGALTATFNGATITSPAGIVTESGAYDYYEIAITFATTTGSFTVRKNNVVVWTFTGTTFTHSTSVTDVTVAQCPSGVLVDDLYIDAGNTFFGDSNVYYQSPTATGRTTTNFACSSGMSFFALVNEHYNYPAMGNAFPDDSGTYIYDVIPSPGYSGDEACMSVAALTGITSIAAVSVRASVNVAATSAGQGTFALGVGNGSFEQFGASSFSVTPGSAFAYIIQGFDQNPLTNATWSPADVLALQAAIKVSASSYTSTPQFVSITPGSGSDGTAIVPASYTGAATPTVGDLIVVSAAGSYRGGLGLGTLYNGWQYVPGTPQAGGTANYCTWLYKVWTNSDAAGQSIWTYGGTTDVTFQTAYQIRGYNASTPFGNVSFVGSATGTMRSVSVTPSAQAFVLAMVGGDHQYVAGTGSVASPFTLDQFESYTDGGVEQSTGAQAHVPTLVSSGTATTATFSYTASLTFYSTSAICVNVGSAPAPPTQLNVTQIGVEVVCPRPLLPVAPLIVVQPVTGGVTPPIPTILGIDQSGATTRIYVQPDLLTGSHPVAAVQLYRGPFVNGPWSLVAAAQVDDVARVNVVTDPSPPYGRGSFYVAATLDTSGASSSYSAPIGPFSHSQID